MKDKSKEETKSHVRGDFKWKDSTVIFEPNKNGRWLVSKQPK